MLTKPPILKKRDVIGIVSPSSGFASVVPHRVMQGVNSLKAAGFEVEFSQHALKQNGQVSGSAEERADDINNFFSNPKITVIMASIGGNHTNQILRYIDYELVKRNPKIVIGYSDITHLHFALQKKASLVSFYGPALLTQFGEYPNILPYTQEYFERALCSKEPIGCISPSDRWTDELLDWTKKQDLSRPRTFYMNRPRIWLRRGEGYGPIMGGCITSINNLVGTEYWPDLSGKIFFWEIPEGEDIFHGHSVERVDHYLKNLKTSGVFDLISGMVIGRPYRYDEAEENKLIQSILSRTKEYTFPILYNIEIGHTDPIATIPLGVHAELNSEKNIFKIHESGVS